jgi:hypothetical protein
MAKIEIYCKSLKATAAIIIAIFTQVKNTVLW